MTGSSLLAPMTARAIHSATPSPHSSPSLPGRDFPNPVAVFNEKFCFTTLDKADVGRNAKEGRAGQWVHPSTRRACSLFSLDDQMAYCPFSRDYGPLNLAFTYSACLALHDKMNAKEFKSRPICLYTSSDPKTKSNMALMVALYFLIVRHQTPWQCFQPIAELELMPFRDAGNGEFDHGLAIQAMQFGLLDLGNFDAREYQYYETPENGDMNILGPFIAFASPLEPAWAKLMAHRRKAIQAAIDSGQPPLNYRPASRSRLTGNHAFKSVLEVFQRQEVGVVVRLNDELYDKRHFTDVDIDHVEMYFDDGSNPSDDIIREFIAMSERYIQAGRAVAVHCKAGLGRTGVLIGAYLIYKYSFTAQEVIGYMRIVRPGMVVGPQQQFMMLNQMKWAGWAARDELLREIGMQATQTLNPLATPPAEDVSTLPRLDLPPAFTKPRQASSSSASPKRGDAVGQPRKTGPVPEPVVAVHSPTPKPEDRLARNRQEYRETASAPSAIKEGASSMRGTKRGLTRKALPPPGAVDGPTTPTRLGLDIQSSLERSPSILSVVSANDRPRKRINGSPLASPGLGPSPPPTRASSPQPTDEMIIDPPPTPTRIPNKLRRELSSPRLRFAQIAHAHAHVHVHSPEPAPPIPTKSGIPVPVVSSTSAPAAGGSYLPSRRQTPLKETHAVQIPDRYTSSPSRIPRAVPVTKGKEDGGVVEGKKEKEREKTGKEGKEGSSGWAAPRLMNMLYGIGRSGN